MTLVFAESFPLGDSMTGEVTKPVTESAEGLSKQSSLQPPTSAIDGSCGGLTDEL